MPRDGSNVYHRPSGIDAVTNTTISSVAYNTNVQDVESDLNTPRPIVAGGTGASSADAALTNLSAEKAKQVVTNWDATSWMAGSFYAASSATGTAPVTGHAFAGIAYYANSTDFVLKATDLTDSRNLTYTRVQSGGTWGSWTSPVFSAPFDALSYNGMQINGNMEVSQEMAYGTGRTTQGYICDGWMLTFSGLSAIGNCDLNVQVPGFTARIYVAVSAGKPSLAATDYLSALQVIEGYRIERLGWGYSSAQPITIGFWTQHAVTGTYSVSVRNGTPDRSYVTTYTQNVSGALEYKTVTIPGDTSGSWNVTNGIGMMIGFAAACGTTLTVPSVNTWTAGNYLAAPGQVNAASATSQSAVLRGVVVLPGTEASSAARSSLIMRRYDDELLLCKRYYEQIFAYDLGYGVAGTNNLGKLFTYVQKRAAPSITVVGTAGHGNCVPTSVDPQLAYMRYIFNVVGTGGYVISANLAIDARL